MIPIELKYKLKPNKSEKPQNLDDESLVKLIATTKNTLFFEILLIRYERVIYYRILEFVDTEKEAVELTKTFFVDLFSEIYLFKGPYRVSVWLYERAYRLCCNYLNKRSEDKKESKLINQRNERLHIEVSDAILYKMKAKKLKKAMALIEPEDKALLMLRYQDDVSMEDLTLLLRLDGDYLKTLLRKAKARIIKIYNEL